MASEAEVRQAADLVRHARHMVALTGAGHSTASGIPDFRSPNSGLWETANPLMVASIWAFRLNPKTFYQWVRPLVQLTLDARPNPAHLALAELERRGVLKAVITQNIDNLHQRAGSQRVLELHGHMRIATCIRCYEETAIDECFVQSVQDGKVPHCPCGGVLKPNVILFGEQLPIRVYNEAVMEVRCCDLLLVAGSSLEVMPAADLPFLAADGGARGILVNLEPTAFDHRATVVIHGDVVDILPRIVDML